MQVKNILSLVVIAIFVTVALLSQNIYGFTSITNITWNGVQIERFSQVVPSEDKPLEFFFESKDDKNTDLSVNFQCEIYSINEDADLNNDNIQNGIDWDDDGIADISQSDLTQVAYDSCGTNTVSSQISYTALGQDQYVFVLFLAPLSS